MQDDVLKNSFNVLRMFVKIYGTSRAPTMLVSMPSSSARHTPLLHGASTHLSVNHFEYLFPRNFEITVCWDYISAINFDFYLQCIILKTY